MWRNVEVKDWPLEPVLDAGAPLNDLKHDSSIGKPFIV